MDNTFSDETRPNAARIYDYYLGGVHNFAVDRKAAEQMMSLYPDSPLSVRANRYFLGRAVRFLTAQGIDQFLDIGSGIPTVGNVHEIAHETIPSARVVYVDIDPLAVDLGQQIIGANPYVTCMTGDVRDPAAILQSPEVRRSLDFSRPIGLMLLAVLHFIPDDELVIRSLKQLCDALPSGSYVTISHGTYDFAPGAALKEAIDVYKRSPTPGNPRPRATIQQLFEGLEMVEPGLVLVSQWRPDDGDRRDLLRNKPERSGIYAGVARKP